MRQVEPSVTHVDRNCMLIEPVSGERLEDDTIDVPANSFDSYVKCSKLLESF